MGSSASFDDVLSPLKVVPSMAGCSQQESCRIQSGPWKGAGGLEHVAQSAEAFLPDASTRLGQAMMM